MSMPDRYTNTVNVISSDGTPLETAACRPSVINNFIGDLGSFESWWNLWKAFMFETSLTIAGKRGPVTQMPYQMLSKYKNSVQITALSVN